MQKEKIYNAAVYARLSKEEEQRGDSASIETQVEMLTRYVTEHGWNLAAVYKDMYNQRLIQYPAYGSVEKRLK